MTTICVPRCSLPSVLSTDYVSSLHPNVCSLDSYFVTKCWLDVSLHCLVSKLNTQIQQQRPESSTVTLPWHACKYRTTIQEHHFSYVFKLSDIYVILYISHYVVISCKRKKIICLFCLFVCFVFSRMNARDNNNRIPAKSKHHYVVWSKLKKKQKTRRKRRKKREGGGGGRRRKQSKKKKLQCRA